MEEKAEATKNHVYGLERCTIRQQVHQSYGLPEVRLPALKKLLLLVAFSFRTE
jgi:hypothetical protein